MAPDGDTDQADFEVQQVQGGRGDQGHRGRDCGDGEKPAQPDALYGEVVSESREEIRQGQAAPNGGFVLREGG